MKPVTIDIPHSLGAVEARRRLEEGFDKILSQVGESAKVSRQWTGDRMAFSATVMGQTISGHLDVLADAVRMEIKLPNVLAMLAGKIKGRVQTQGQLLLENKPPPPKP
ncbi:polyhydroxyalkanoic acid system family protein [Phenylobacterium sp.]|jgi:putative polyhydroxyalkanoate system protein|uniref:polyhydroxyalkanoic acid system family protein n=1 Tax=Phenylobacterium sp. TaxID=1871053 RepID=UPI004036CD08